MKGTREQRRTFWLLSAGVALVALSLLSGLLQLYGLPGDDDREAGPPDPSLTSTDPGEVPSGTGTPDSDAAAEPAGPEDVVTTVTAVGRTGTLLAVEIRNDSGVRIRSARVRIVARDAAGRAVTTSGSARSTCCTVLDLPDGETYGLWASIPTDAPPVSEVEVEVLEAEVGNPDVPPSTVTASGIELGREPGAAVVTTTLVAEGAVDGYVDAQAFLTDPGGRLVAVVSGRFWCFADGVSRTVRIQLPQPVPRDTRVSRVVARSVPDKVLAPAPSACH